jgi:3D (Asp-Asp-Asp) domain-containing protein
MTYSSQWIAVAAALLLPLGVASRAAEAQIADAARDFVLDPPTELAAAARRPIWVTAYIVRPATQDSSPAAVPLLGKDGKASGIALSHDDWCNAAMEGTVVVTLSDGMSRTFNFAGVGSKQVTDCSDIFRKAAPKTVAAVSRSLFAAAPTDAPFGLGAKSRFRLVPYRSIAVDLGPSGPFDLETVLFIPKLKGLPLTLPDGRQISHDGYVIAVDRGGLIRDNHIDFFKGPSRTDALPSALRSSADRPLDAFLITDADIVAALRAEHVRH